MELATLTPEESLLERIAGGDQQALTALYSRHHPALFAYLSLFTADHGLVEEVIQDTMLAVWNGAGGFAGHSTVKSWIFAIGRRRAIDALRKRKVSVTTDDELATVPDSQPGPEHIALANATESEILDAFSRMSQVHREVLVLTFIHELSYQELSDVLGTPLGTVKSRLSNARRALRSKLRDGTA